VASRFAWAQRLPRPLHISCHIRSGCGVCPGLSRVLFFAKRLPLKIYSISGIRRPPMTPPISRRCVFSDFMPNCFDIDRADRYNKPNRVPQRRGVHCVSFTSWIDTRREGISSDGSFVVGGASSSWPVGAFGAVRLRGAVVFERCERWTATIASLVRATRGNAASAGSRSVRADARPALQQDLEPTRDKPAESLPMISQIPTCVFGFPVLPRSVNAGHDCHVVPATSVSPYGSQGLIRCRAFLARRGVVRFLRPITVGPALGPPRIR